MSVRMDPVPARKPRLFPLRKTARRLARDPLHELERIVRSADGEVVRLDLGVARPLLVTHPDHVQQVLRTEAGNFPRDGMFWRPLHRLFGDSILGEYGPWETSRKVLQPAFSTRTIRGMSADMATAINDAVDALEEPARNGRPVDVHAEMARIVNETVIKVLFGDKIRQAEADRLAPAMETVATSVALRFLLPFIPPSVPLPKDGAFNEGVREMDEVLFGLVDRFRNDPGEDHDVFTALCRARMAEGSELTDQWVRDNLLSMFATSIETTTVALTWLWPVLAEHPDVARRLHDEVDATVGGDRVGPEHLDRLPYVRQVIQELLRLYPVGWIFPRTTVRPTRIGNVPVRTGQTVLISPYLSHRLESVWERALEFDPERFTPERSRGRHRYAYFPFGGGPHQCIGRYVFNVEAELILASILSRFRPVMNLARPVEPRIGATVRPRDDLTMRLVPKVRG